MTTIANVNVVGATAIVNASGRAVVAGVGTGDNVVYDGAAIVALMTLPVVSVENVDNPIVIIASVHVLASGAIPTQVVTVRRDSLAGTAVASFPFTAGEATSGDVFYVPVVAFDDPGDVGGLSYVIAIEPD